MAREEKQFFNVSLVRTDDGPNEVDWPPRFPSQLTLAPREKEVPINGSDSGT